jgi:hypothetical protein
MGAKLALEEPDHSIVAFELDTLDAARLNRLVKTMIRISCMKADGDTLVGIPGWYMKEKLGGLAPGNLQYGEDGGVKRKATHAYVHFTKRGTASAFALVCAAGSIFHRLRPRHVKESVYLAMLCGQHATSIYTHLLELHRTRFITLDSLPHSITYYLRGQFRAAVAIDTPAAFDASVSARAYAVECMQHAKRPRERALGRYRDTIVREIQRGEIFVPIAECSNRGHSRQRPGYKQAHMVVPPVRYDRLSFRALCVEDECADKDPRWRDAEKESRRAEKEPTRPECRSRTRTAPCRGTGTGQGRVRSRS